jgi:hypothetical protein
MGCVQAACIIKYEELKDKCIQPGFKFAIEYPQALLELQALYDSRLVSEFWPNMIKAENCIESIRRRQDGSIVVAIDTESLEISDDLKYITHNQEKKLFLQYDNQDMTGNRILVYFSDTGAQIMDAAKEWHIDGTFKNCPKIFKQLLTIQCVIKNEALNTAFMFLQTKTRDTYTAAFKGMQNACFLLLDRMLSPFVILLDFEIAMQQACLNEFLSVRIKGMKNK